MDTKTVVFLRTHSLLICIKHNGDDASKAEHAREEHAISFFQKIHVAALAGKLLLAVF